MMKLSRACSNARVSLSSTITPRSPSTDSLFSRVWRVNDPQTSIVPVLDKWVEQGNTVNKEDLRSLVHRTRKMRRFQHALEISQWMTDRRYFPQTPIDIAFRLSLIYEVRGLEHAERYFSIIPKKMKFPYSYGSLMDCYVKEKSVEKVEGLLREMEKMKLSKGSFIYNRLVNLYAQIGQYSKIDDLMEEMERKGIPQDKFTLNNRLSACVNASDIEGMENVLNQMEENPDIDVNWSSYVIAGNGYLKVGLTDKALAMLKKVEDLMANKSTEIGYGYLINSYANMGLKDNVYRIWELMKTKGPLRSYSYSRMIASICKMDDFEGAEKILAEWEPRCSVFYDFRVLNQLVSCYCRNGLPEKAESLVRKAMEKAAESGSSPYPSTWNHLAMGYLKTKNMAKAVEMSKNSMRIGRQGWKPNPNIVIPCLDHFETQRDVEGAIDFCRLVEKSGLSTREVYHSLLRTHIAANRPVFDTLVQMKSAGFSADEETHKILEKMPDQHVAETSNEDSSYSRRILSSLFGLLKLVR